jgi:WhiB family redox-sensing transcriptional regulator
MGKQKTDLRVPWQADPPAGVSHSDWRESAACTRVAPELFFPAGKAAVIWLEALAAKRVCGGCPVRTQCLRWALDHGVSAGIWGGTTDEERRLLRQHGTAARPRLPELS